MASFIFAPATPPGRGAISIFRLSGEGAGAAVASLAGPLPRARRATLRCFRDRSGEVIDRGLLLWMPEPDSFTGEDTAEFHVHGGRAVSTAITSALIDRDGRPAEPGEFSRRAFMNGKMDLLQAEAIADLVDAETEAQRRQALAQMGGASSVLLRDFSDRLRRTLAWQEALIDFPDEDLPPEVEAQLEDEIAELLAAIRALQQDTKAGIRLRDGLVFAVAGPPNVGKSSLINALCRRDIAIVSPEPGTTRDAIEATVNLGGVKVTLVDTAGLREPGSAIEAEGIRRARARADAADLVISVASPDCGFEPMTAAHVYPVFNKIDLAAPPAGVMGVSAMSGAGLTVLENALSDLAVSLTSAHTGLALTRARHEAALKEAGDALEAAASIRVPELRGEELRLALQAIGRITGAVDVEAVLGTIFSSFCIGK